MLYTILSTVMPVAIQFFGLFLSEHVFQSRVRRLFIIIMTLFSTVHLVTQVRIQSSYSAYLIGLFSSAWAIRSIMLFWVYEPYKTFVQVGLSETSTNHHGKDINAQWKSCPESPSLDRADWALNLILDIRAVRWCYSATGEGPCKFHTKLMAERQETQFRKAISNPASLLLTLFGQLFLGLLVLDSLIVYVFPQLQATIFDQKYSQSYLVYNIMYYRLDDIIHIAVDIIALVASIDALFSISSIIGTFLYLAGATSFLSFATQPSPWGSLNSVYRGGVSGKVASAPSSLSSF